MGLEQVEWFDSRCDERPYPPFSHYWTSVANVDRGTMFMCKFCHRLRWYPSSWEEAARFGDMLKRMDADDAYRTLLLDHPIAADRLARLNDLRNIRKVVTNEEQFRDIVIITTKIGNYLHQEEV